MEIGIPAASLSALVDEWDEEQGARVQKIDRKRSINWVGVGGWLYEKMYGKPISNSQQGHNDMVAKDYTERL